jgi:hypothetical protein
MDERDDAGVCATSMPHPLGATCFPLDSFASLLCASGSLEWTSGRVDERTSGRNEWPDRVGKDRREAGERECPFLRFQCDSCSSVCTGRASNASSSHISFWPLCFLQMPGLVSTRSASTRLARILFLLLIGSAAADSYEIPPVSSAPRGAETPRDPVDSIAVFTLIRGGASESDYEMFLNSRECVHDVMAGVQYDNIAFHEGNVPAAIQTILGQKM